MTFARAISGGLLLALGLVPGFFFRDGMAAANSGTTAQSQAKADAGDFNLATLSLEELSTLKVETVFGASKFEQKTTEAPSSVTVVSADEIKRYGYRTLADVLQSLQGFHVTSDRNYSFLGARGVSLGDFNGRILLLVDGHRVNNNLTDGAFIGTEFILDVDLIDRVEVIRGPGSVLYGNNAFFGVINVVTRTGKQLNTAEVSGEFAEFDTYKGRITFGKAFTNGVELLMSASIYESGGEDGLYFPEFDLPALNDGVANGLDGDSLRSFFGTLRYRDFTLQGAIIKREKGNPTGYDSDFSTNPAPWLLVSTFNDKRLRTTDERGYVALKYAHSFEQDLDVAAQVYYECYNYEIGKPYTAFNGMTLLFSDFSREKQFGEWWGAELQINKRLWERHLVTLGGEYRDDFRQDREIFDESGQLDPTAKNYYKSAHSHGIYVQGDFAVRTNLHFNGGVRYDQYGDYDPSFNPRLALIYDPFEKSTVKALYGTAFRTPNFVEQTVLGQNQVLQPEEITSYELVLEQGIGSHLRSSLSGYYNEMKDLIFFEGGISRNFDAETRGMEIALEGSWASGIRGRVSYTFQETENHSVRWEMPDSPCHLAKVNVSVPLVKEKLFASLEFQYTSDRRSLHNAKANGQPLTVQGADADGFGVLNFTLFSQNLVKNLELSASVYNLLDESYSDPATRFHVQDTLPREGRSFRLKLTYRF